MSTKDDDLLISDATAKAAVRLGMMALAGAVVFWLAVIAAITAVLIAVL